MQLWIGASPELCPGPVGEVAVCTNEADGTLNYGDDNSGDVVSMQPDGTLGHRPNGTKGDWEVYQRDTTVNVLVYHSGQNLVPSGIPYKVRYRAR